MSEQFITEFQKNSLEKIRVTIQQYKGRRYISLWVWFKNDEDNWQPSKKGLNLSLDLLPELKKAVDMALAKTEFENETGGDSLQPEEEGRNG